MNTLRHLPDHPPAPWPDPNGPGASGTGSEDASLQQALRRVQRHKLLLFLIVAVATGLTLVFVSVVEPRYTAQAIVSIEGRKPQFVEIQSVVSEVPREAQAIWGEVAQLRSHRLADQVITALGLESDPEINPALQGDDEFSITAWLNPARWLPAGLGAGAAAEEPVPVDADRARAELISNFRSRLEVSVERETGLIEIAYTSGDPVKAATIVNTLVEIHQENQVSEKYQATQRAVAWLSEQVNTLHGEVLAAERAVEEYRASANLVDAGGTNVTDQQLVQLNNQLIAAQADRAAAEARLRQIRALQGNSDAIATAPDVLASALIQSLRTQEATLSAQASELSERYGERHPLVVNNQAQLREARQQLAREVSRIVTSVENEVAAADARVATLRQRLDSLTGQAGSLNQSEVRLRELQREADATRALYETFLLRLKEIGTQLGVQVPDTTFVAAAVPPLGPSFPVKSKILTLVVLGSFLLGLVIVLLVDMHQNGVENADQLEQVTGQRVLGLVPALGPAIGWRRFGLGRPERHLVKEPKSFFAESILNIRSQLLNRASGRAPKTVLVTSALPGEGKTTLALALARLAARCGQRVLIIDGDLARPALHQKLGVLNQGGLVDVLRGVLPVEQAIGEDTVSGAHFLLAGRRPDHPADLLTSREMQALLFRLAGAYDLILVDSSPVMALSDAQLLSRLTDQTLFVVQWRKTPRSAVAGAVRQIQEMGGVLAGCVLSRIDLRRYVHYDTSGLRYYMGYARQGSATGTPAAARLSRATALATGGLVGLAALGLTGAGMPGEHLDALGQPVPQAVIQFLLFLFAGMTALLAARRTRRGWGWAVLVALAGGFQFWSALPAFEAVHAGAGVAGALAGVVAGAVLRTRLRRGAARITAPAPFAAGAGLDTPPSVLAQNR